MLHYEKEENPKVTATGPILNIKYTSHLNHRFFVHSYLIKYIYKKKNKFLSFFFYSPSLKHQCTSFMTGEFSLTGYESGGARVIGKRGGQGDPREITRGSKWKIPGNSLKTTQNILWLLLVLFFCPGCYYSPAQNSRFSLITTVGSSPSFFYAIFTTHRPFGGD